MNLLNLYYQTHKNMILIVFYLILFFTFVKLTVENAVKNFFLKKIVLSLDLLLIILMIL